MTSIPNIPKNIPHGPMDIPIECRPFWPFSHPFLMAAMAPGRLTLRGAVPAPGAMPRRSGALRARGAEDLGLRPLESVRGVTGGDFWDIFWMVMKRWNQWGDIFRKPIFWIFFGMVMKRWNQRVKIFVNRFFGYFFGWWWNGETSEWRFS